MTLDTALMLGLIFMFMFFVVLSWITKKKIFNLFAFAMLLWLDVAYITNTVGILITVLLMIYLLIDMFWSTGGGHDL